jgi:hypothetical protein
MTDNERKWLQSALDRADRNGVTEAYTTNPRHALQFYTKREAADWAARIGWQKNDAHRVTVLGLKLWTIHGGAYGMLTARGYLRLFHDRAERGAAPSAPLVPAR